MADEAEIALEPTDRGKGRLMQMAIIALLMIGEGVGVFFLAKSMRSEPVAALAGVGHLAFDISHLLLLLNP